MNSTGRCCVPPPSDLDRFVSEQNIARYRKLLDPGILANQRSMIFTLLNSEFKTLRERNVVANEFRTNATWFPKER